MLSLQKIESILLPGKAYWDIAHNITEVDAMRKRWYRYFRGKDPHTKTIKREGYYLVSFWLGKQPHIKVIKREGYYLMAFWLGERG